MNRFGRLGSSTSSKKQKDSSESSSSWSYANADSPPPPIPVSAVLDQEGTAEPQPSQVSQIAASDYAKRTIQLNKQIASLGAGFEFDFPRVAVVGAQSSGKSSLVEAISGINVPRDSGTCTRCPMECSMINDGSDTWSCTINLKVGANAGRPTSSQRFGPQRITDRGSVDLWIRRAQTAILSPHRSPAEFEDMSTDELRRILKEDNQTLSFSKDLIEIEVRDPKLPPLTFVDLPGLIQHHQESQTIKLVENMVKFFIGGERRSNTLMLIVMPAPEDVNNQQAMEIAKRYDRHGIRTIGNFILLGVLTKPDRLGAGDIGLKASLQAALEGGGDHPLKNGYYCIRLPDDAERQETLGRDELSARADKFFKEAEPWSDVANRSVFGVENLVSSVSKLLVKIIESNLPKLKKQVDDKLKQCRIQLDNLPPPPTGRPLIQLMELIRLFAEDVNKAVMGLEHRQYAQKNRGDIYANFRAEIWRTGINFKPTFSSNVIQHWENQEESWNHASIPEPERVPMPNFAVSMDLKEVRQIINKSIAWELPGHVPFQATLELVRRSTSQWRDPALACFNTVFEHSWQLFDEMITKRFESYESLKYLVKDTTRQHYQACKDAALVVLEKAVQLETSPLYTQNHHYYNSQRDKWRKHFRDAVTTPGIFGSQMQVQEYQSELDLMGDVRAYFKVAFKRFVDYIPLLIEHELSQEFANHLYERLIENVPLHDAQKVTDLMAEKASIRERREQLSSDISRLQAMSLLLKDYEQDAYSDEAMDDEDVQSDVAPSIAPESASHTPVSVSALSSPKPQSIRDITPEPRLQSLIVEPGPFIAASVHSVPPGRLFGEPIEAGSIYKEAYEAQPADDLPTTTSTVRRGGKKGKGRHRRHTLGD
uniref:Uncharacterized protein n=1 Tax=Moniliophthora roreri TaxID=221103 RepID=A0A0W0FIH9_MONRR